MAKSGRDSAKTTKEQRDKGPANPVKATAARSWRRKKREESLELERVSKEEGRRKFQAQLLGPAAVAANAAAEAAGRGTEPKSPASGEDDLSASEELATMPSRIKVPPNQDEAKADAGGEEATGGDYGSNRDESPSPLDEDEGGDGGRAAAFPSRCDGGSVEFAGGPTSPAAAVGPHAAPAEGAAGSKSAAVDNEGLEYEKNDVAMGNDDDDGKGGPDKAGRGSAQPVADGYDGINPALREAIPFLDPRIATLPASPTPSLVQNPVDLTGGDNEEEEGVEGLPPEPASGIGDGDAVNSPQKKKLRQSKKEKKEKKKKRKEGEKKRLGEKRDRDSSPLRAADADGKGVAPSPSALRIGRFGAQNKEASNEDKGKSRDNNKKGDKVKEKRVSIVAEDYNHVHKRVLVEGKVKMRSPPDEENRLADEFVKVLIGIVNNAKTVDSSFVLVSKVSGKYPWIAQANQINFNHAILGRHVTTASNVEFKRQKPWGNMKSKDDDGLVNPSVFFTMAWGCDVLPKEIINGIKTEFQKLGGEFLRVKKLDAFNVECAARVFGTHLSNSWGTMEYELKAILTEGRNREEKEDPHWEFATAPIPDFQLRLQVPRIPGLNSTMFENWPERLKAARKVPHVECDVEKVDQFRSLVGMAKKHGVVKKFWGAGVHLSSYDGGATVSGLQRNALVKFSGKHVEIQESYEQDALIGIIHLDKPVPIRNSDGDVVAHASLRHILYIRYKIGKGIELFWEIHQMGLMADVDVVRPRDNEARHIITQMNKNMAAFLVNDLTTGDEAMCGTFVNELVRACIDRTLVEEVPRCRWDASKRELWTPRDAALEAAKKREEAEWYVNIEGLNIGGRDKAKRKGGQANRDNLLRFNDASSFVTLNVKEGDGAGGKGYGGDEGMPVLSLGKARAVTKPGQDNKGKDDGGEEDGVSALTGTSGVSSSRKEVQRLQRELAAAKAHIASLSEPRSTASREESGSSSEDSSSESSSSSSESSSSAPPSSGGAADGPVADPAG